LDLSTPENIFAFWRNAGPDKWFKRDDALDAQIRVRFRETHEAAASGALAAWEGSAEGALALLILLDQFPRNMFRGTSRAFATDATARAIADRAIANGFDLAVPADMKSFFYLPFMHSEQLADQERCVALYAAAGDDYSLNYAREHADIIRRFGRFPHRNAALGRTSTPEEKAFLESGGFSG
jgi:uncharacterized protein (DUF924 family)